MPVPLWVTLAALKAAGVGTFYLHRKLKSLEQKRWPARSADDETQDKNGGK
jgi:hypothetical protein